MSVGTRGIKGEKMRLVWNPDRVCYEDDEEYYKLKELVLCLAKLVGNDFDRVKELVKELEEMSVQGSEESS